MQRMTRTELVALLDDIRDRVARGDSFDGKVHYALGTDQQQPFEVVAVYRIDNLLGQGSTAMVGVDLPQPLRCACGDTDGPFENLPDGTYRCESCVGSEQAA